MSRASIGPRPLRLGALAVAAAAALAAGPAAGWGASATSSAADAPGAASAVGSRGARADASAGCGNATAATIAAVDATAADHIYANELAGTEVSSDLAQVTGASDLIAALAGENRAAALKAVSRIVYHPAWHIVRLRAIDLAGRILADVGGPYVIAPISGVLRSRGRAVGSFVMSVQDDAGFTKLETRFVGDPIGIYATGKLVAERYATFPRTPPAGAGLTLAGTRYLVVRKSYNAFPVGALTAVVLVAAATTSGASCSVVRAGEFGRIAETFARLAFSLPQHYGGFASTVHTYTGADVFVRDGATLLASSGGPGPARPPASGSTDYQGKRWLVFSFEPAPPARVYVLAPPATIAASGSTSDAGATRMPSSISRTTSPTHSHISAPAAMSHSFTPRSK